MDPFVRPGMKFGPQVEHLVTRYPGTGGPDTSKYDWATNMQRDTLASMVSHHDLLCGLAIADNTSLARQRVQLLDKMRQPCGKRPQDMDEDHDENVGVGDH
eukprot:TRINITY_DN5967_c0_g1_i1.p3 TRINITY_DN5967_c0_g1~~TRINITY_DN5967_c0_g1_i1.p3  ORF type:complete len:101 (+),score=27.98 TRINITY_DN5967_c0_g1_i1:181-483(+)